MKKIKVIAFVAIFSALLAAQAGPAYAKDSSISLMSELTPSLLHETNSANQFQVTRNDASISIDSAQNTDKLLADLPSVSIQADSTSILYQEGLVVVHDKNAQTSSVIQPTSTGGRILTVINSPESSHCSHFAFDVPKGTTFELASEGFYLEHGPGVLLHISDAWALDSAGINVPTEYSWAAGTLTQCVNASTSDIKYPILADPGWDYTYSGVKKLIVSAHVMNDSLQLGPYLSGAQSKWQEFANNLNK